MSPITDPAEEYFKDGLWGWVTDQWKKLVADAAGHLQVDVLTSGLPTGGATAANQATMITALQLIDDLRNTLNSVAIDELDVVLDGQNVDVEVTQAAPADLAVATHGWDGAAWRKLPLLWGYSDRHFQAVKELTADVNDTLQTTAVAAGYVHVIQAITGFNQNNSFTLLDAEVRTATASGPNLIYQTSPVLKVPYSWYGEIVLKEGDYIHASFKGNTAGDDIYLRVWGYQMKVAE